MANIAIKYDVETYLYMCKYENCALHTAGRSSRQNNPGNTQESPLPSPLPLLRSTLCARGWPSATPDDPPPRALCVPAEAGGVYGVVRLSPPPQPARLLSQPASSAGPPPQPARLYCSWASQRAALAEKIW